MGLVSPFAGSTRRPDLCADSCRTFLTRSFSFVELLLVAALSKEHDMYPTYPHFDLGNKLESEVDETHEAGAIMWWCIMVVVPPFSPT